MIKPTITREFLASLKFEVMTPFQRNGFAGCDSPVPLIAETADYIVIIDGDFCEVYGDPEGDGSFEQIAQCANIRALPMPQY